MPETQPQDAANWIAVQETLRGNYTGCAADFRIDQDMNAYTPAQHDLWRRLHRRQSDVARRYAAKAFLAGLHHLDIAADGVPDFELASKRLRALTGWEIVAVPGLIPDDAFFTHLAARRFPVTVWLREEHEIDYLVEPDVFHDFFGHLPLLTQPVFADYLQAYGQKGTEAMAMGATKILSRLFWYMVEFGLIREQGVIKAYGAGMLSSAAETAYSVASPKPQRLRFDLARVMATDFRIDAFQETYFVLESYDELFAAMAEDFAPLYRRFLAADPIPACAIRAGDRLINIAA
jgi:phenylalanine-4-hydroxylase